MAAELKAPQSNKVLLSPNHPKRGLVLLALYVNDISISIVDVPPDVCMHLSIFLELFLSALYKLPLKWEKSPE